MRLDADRSFCVYTLAGKSGVLYTGITNDLVRRISEHKQRQGSGFAKRYGITKLVWFEIHGRAASAIGREKQIKGRLRSKKVALISAENPHWLDLSDQLN